MQFFAQRLHVVAIDEEKYVTSLETSCLCRASLHDPQDLVIAIGVSLDLDANTNCKIVRGRNFKFMHSWSICPLRKIALSAHSKIYAQKHGYQKRKLDGWHAMFLLLHQIIT